MNLEPKGLKSQRGFTTNNKSNTVINLPGINKASRLAQKHQKQNKSSYIQTISYLSANVQYDNKNALEINKEHTKLRQILRKMNDDTLHIIDQLTPRHFQTKPTREQISLIRDREIQNNKKMISNLSYDIERLKEKANRMFEHVQRQELHKKIKQIHQQIQNIKANNTNSKYSIFKDGKEIFRQQNDEYHIKLSFLQNDKHLFEVREQKLRNQNNRVEQEIQHLQQKSSEIDQKLNNCEQEFNVIKNKQLEENINKNRTLSMKNKKLEYETIKKKIQNFNTHQQFKYYKKLKDLQYEGKSYDLVFNKIQGLDQKIQTSKIEMNRLQKDLRSMKQNKMQKSRMVIEYLQKQRKNKEGNSVFGGQSVKLLNRESLTEEIKGNNNTESILRNRKWESQTIKQQFKNSGQNSENIQQQSTKQLKTKENTVTNEVKEQQKKEIMIQE